MKKLYTISDLAMMSMLSTRTLRNYIKNGILSGQKCNGIWYFTPEDIDAFFGNPAVAPSIQAKRNAIVSDFILNKGKATNQICMIFDLPNSDGKEISEFFVHQFCTGGYGNDLQFVFENAKQYTRIILKGQVEDVQRLMNMYTKYIQGK